MLQRFGFIYYSIGFFKDQIFSYFLKAKWKLSFLVTSFAVLIPPATYCSQAAERRPNNICR